MSARQDKEQLLEDLEEQDLRYAREDLLEFILEMNPNFRVNFHHRIICERLTRLANEEGQRIIINVPPQYGKSEIVSRNLPAWMLGRKPEAKVILASYAADLANSFNRDCQAIMESDEYVEIFPNTVISPRAKTKRTQNYVETSGHGYLYSVGVGGATTGRSANPLFIVDDPIKDLAEALSPAHRKRVLDWYYAVAQTRLSLSANVIIMHTRWHEDDLAGALLAKAKKDPLATQWEVINFPALVEVDSELHEDDPRLTGEALWPDVKGGPQKQNQVKIDVGSFMWAAIFQGNPQSTGGNMVNADWWRYYKMLPEQMDQTIISVDCSFKELSTSDYVVLQVWGRKGANKYLIDQIRKRMNVMKTCQMLVELSLKYPKARGKYVEAKANGDAVMQFLEGKISGLIPVNPSDSKIARVAGVQPQIEAGNIYLPHEDISPFPLADFITEWSLFPFGKNDDQVDAGTQAIDQLSSGENNYLRKLVGRGPVNETQGYDARQ